MTASPFVTYAGKAKTRLSSALAGAWLPPLLLLAALSTVFLFSNDRGYFYRPGHHDFLSSHGMTLAANISPEHRMLMFIKQRSDGDGEIGYDFYSRFPIGAFALIKASILPFGNNLSMQIHAARVVMLLFFAAAALMAYLSVVRLTPNRLIGVTAVLLAFSSYYCLYYNDMVFNDVPSLFGMTLAFHGMVVFAQEGRFRQMLLKTCAALLLGWQVYGLLAAFIGLGLAIELTTHWRAALVDGEPRPWLSRHLARIRVVARLILSSRYLVLGVVAILFGVLVLGSNFANEYFALDGETPVNELNVFKAMLWRLGIAEPEVYAPP